MSIEATEANFEYDLFLEFDKDLENTTHRFHTKIYGLTTSLSSGARKTISKTVKFVKKHKEELLVGAAIVAAGVGIAAITGYTLSMAVSGVVVAGVGSIFSSEQKSNPHIPNVPPPTEKDLARMQKAPYLPPIDFHPDTFIATADGLWTKGQFYPNQEFLQTPPFRNTPPVPELKLPYTSPTRSTSFTVSGNQIQTSHIVWINGINNTVLESAASGMYINRLSGGHAVAGIYNCSHGSFFDIVEALFVNHLGHSPNTSELLEAEWRAFHKFNDNNPHAKLLQVCHSQGAIAVKNTLEKVPQEIRDRVIVVAIAPAFLVPKRLCFQSYNYTSRRDFIPQCAPVRNFKPYDDVIIHRFDEEVLDCKDELVILEPHSEAEFHDHGFQSPTFLEVLKNRLEDYKKHRGEYFPHEKGIN